MSVFAKKQLPLLSRCRKKAPPRPLPQQKESRQTCREPGERRIACICHEIAGEDGEQVEFAAPDGDFLADINQGDRRAWVEAALEQLPDHQRVPLVLYHFEDQPYEDIARQLGVSLSKVKTDIMRGRAALAQVLLRSGTDHESLTAQR